MVFTQKSKCVFFFRFLRLYLKILLYFRIYNHYITLEFLIQCFSYNHKVILIIAVSNVGIAFHFAAHTMEFSTLRDKLRIIM